MEGGDADIFKTARVDPVEGLKGQVHIQRNSVERNLATDGDAHKTEFFPAGPDSVISLVPAGRNPHIPGSSYHDLFEFFNKIHDAETGPGQLEDGIKDELTGTVKCDVAPPLYVVKSQAFHFQKARRNLQMVPVPSPSDSKYPGVLKNKDHVPVESAGSPGIHQLELEPVGGGKIHEARIDAPGKAVFGHHRHWS